MRILQRLALPLLLILLANDIEINPGPETSPTQPPFRFIDLDPRDNFDSRGQYIIRCLSFNARSLANKILEFQSLVVDFDMVAVTETCLKQDIMNCEVLPGNNFKIHCKNRANRIGGGVMLAVRNNILSIRRKDLENDQTEMLTCEIPPKMKKKILVLVFYRPPKTDLNYMKDFKKALKLVCKSNFESIIVCGDFNLPDIDWNTRVAVKNDSIHSFFAKTVKDNYLHQPVDFPTRLNNTLDLLLKIYIPDKVINMHGFEDVIDIDHTLVSFDLDLNIYKDQNQAFSLQFQKRKLVDPIRNSNEFALESCLC